MGKRQRRRLRERQRTQNVPQSQHWDYPTTHDPLLRVFLKSGADPAQAGIIGEYWKFTTDGTWACRVADLGQPRSVTETVAAFSEAALLKVPCRQCGEPLAATSRAQATQLAGHDLQGSKWHSISHTPLCAACQAAAAAEERERQQRQAEQERRRRENLRRKIDDLLARENELTLDTRDPLHSPVDIIVLAAMHRMATALNRHEGGHGVPVPSLEDLTHGWTGSADRDLETIKSLYTRRWLAIHHNTPHDAFFERDGELMLTVDQVRWRLPFGKVSAVDAINAELQSCLGIADEIGIAARKEFTEFVQDMEVWAVRDYLDDLLTRVYGYPATPRERAAELVDIIRAGLTEYTRKQMNALAWRAADSAASWKERTPRVGPPEAASAAVTILRRKLEDARERRRPVPEYDPPKSLTDPSALHPADLIRQRLQELQAWEASPREKQAIECPECDEYGWIEEGGKPRTCDHPLVKPTIMI